MQISKLKDRITATNKKVDHHFDITKLHEKHFKEFDQKIDDISNQLANMLQINKVRIAKVTDLMEQKFIAAVSISEWLIHMAYDHRLTAGTLHQDALLEIVNYVNKIVVKSELHSFINEPSDLFLVETSYLYRPDKNTFVLSLHILLVLPHNLIPLYEFLPHPVHFNFSGNISVTPEVCINNMIAVGLSKSYQTLSSSELQNCIKMVETYFCKGRNVLQTDVTKMCIRALYLASANSIQRRCKFSIGDAQEKIFSLDSSMYVVYSVGTISTYHQS